jgi:hypothetical protein
VHSSFARAATPRAGAGVACRANGDAEEPVGQLLGPRDRARLSRQDQECGLERILRRVPIAQHAPANAQDHRTMSVHQGRERGLRGAVSPRDKPPEQLRIARMARRPEREQPIQPVPHPAR